MASAGRCPAAPAAEGNAAASAADAISAGSSSRRAITGPPSLDDDAALAGRGADDFVRADLHADLAVVAGAEHLLARVGQLQLRRADLAAVDLLEGSRGNLDV